MTETVAGRGAALVTGGARRIGRELCLSLAHAGFDIAIHYNASAAEAETLRAEIEGLGRRACVVGADLADVVAAAAMISDAARALGPLTLLVNNASVFEDDRLETITGATWNSHIDINLRAPVLLAQMFAEQAPDGATIINILDQRVLKPNPQFFSYSLSKAALWFATRTMAQALAPRIRVNGVGPGPTLPSIHQSPDDFAAEAANVPLGRRATPRAIANAVLYLVDAEAVTGQMIAVDGGQHLAWRTPDIPE